MRPRLLACAVLLTIVAAPPGAARAAGWLAPAPYSETGINSAQAEVAAAGTGDLAFGYLRSVPSTPSRVALRLKPAGAGLSGEQILGNPANYAGRLGLGGGKNGTLLAAWTDGSSGVGLARRTPGAPSFAPLATFAPPAGEFAVDVAQPVVLPSGEAIVVYETFSSGTYRVRAIDLPVAAGSATAIAGAAGGGAIDVITPPPSGNAYLTLTRPVADAEGRVYVAYQSAVSVFGITSVDTQSAAVAIRPPGGSFAAPVVLGHQTSTMLATGLAVGVPSVAAGPGLVIAGWGERDTTGFVQLRFRELTGGAAAATTTTTTPGGFPATTRVAVDPSGAVVAAWTEQAMRFTSANHVRGLVRPAGGAFSAPAVIADPGVFTQLGDIAISPAGEALVAWARGNSWDEVSVRPPGGTFGPVERATPQLDAQAAAPSTAYDAAGLPYLAFITLESGDASQNGARYALRDGGAPRIGAFAVPASGVTGQPLTFSVEAVDDLSPLDYSWDFGDGSSAGGRSVTHAYGAPGSYTVSVKVTDGAGNTVTRAAPINVAPAAAATPPDASAPSLTSLRLQHSRFAVERRSTASIAAKNKARKKTTPKGTSFLLSLSERATVVIQIRRVSGRRRTPVATLVRVGRGPGAVSILFSGRIDRKALPAGRYEATFTAIDAAGNRSRAQTKGFTITR